MATLTLTRQQIYLIGLLIVTLLGLYYVIPSKQHGEDGERAPHDPASHGRPVFEQRLIAVGDLHGGMSRICSVGS